MVVSIIEVELWVGMQGSMMNSLKYASVFDETLAREGPPAVFMFDADRRLRMEHMWTRDAWTRAEQPLVFGEKWVLLRDKASGFVGLALVTSPALLCTHPAFEFRSYLSFEEAKAAREAFGDPPITTVPW